MENIKVFKNLGIPSRRKSWLKKREGLLTSSEVAAAFDQSPFLTPLELYARKAGLVDEGFEENSRMKAGRMLEPAVAAWVAEEMGVKARPFRDFYADTENRLGASFDWEIPEMEGKEGRGILEIKCVDYLVFNGSFKEGYTDRKWHPIEGSDDVRAPVYIELQVQLQMLLTGRSWAVIGVLVGGSDLKILHRTANPVIQQKIVAQAQKFWAMVDAKQQPEADFARDFETLKRLYAVPDPRETIADDDAGKAMKAIAVASDASERKRQAEAEEKEAKARLMAILGEAEQAILPDGSKVTWKADKRGRRIMRLTPAMQMDEAA